MATVILTVGLAFIGSLATYLNGLRLTQRQARLARVNLQLSESEQGGLLGRRHGRSDRRRRGGGADLV
ncbi:hypothetical protein [Streptomyces sp. NPDC060027]|uniref:hypothetical protein n=1 Tax=Streptomyces sp. NPDC060027 TaxID=3347040 RepID=UPI0036C6CA96